MIKPTQIDWSIPGTFGKLQAIYCHVGLSLDHATCDRYGESALYMYVLFLYRPYPRRVPLSLRYASSKASYCTNVANDYVPSYALPKEIFRKMRIILECKYILYITTCMVDSRID